MYLSLEFRSHPIFQCLSFYLPPYLVPWFSFVFYCLISLPHSLSPSRYRSPSLPNYFKLSLSPMVSYLSQSPFCPFFGTISLTVPSVYLFRHFSISISVARFALWTISRRFLHSFLLPPCAILKWNQGGDVEALHEFNLHKCCGLSAGRGLCVLTQSDSKMLSDATT